jgi:hypothetical protein
MGKPYLSNMDFLKNGVPASIIATIVREVVRFNCSINNQRCV